MGWASDGKPWKKRLRSSCSMVCLEIHMVKSSSWSLEELAVDQQIGGLEIAGALRQLLDRIPRQ